jgi:hypothetical protein
MNSFSLGGIAAPYLPVVSLATNKAGRICRWTPEGAMQIGRNYMFCLAYYGSESLVQSYPDFVLFTWRQFSPAEEERSCTAGTHITGHKFPYGWRIWPGRFQSESVRVNPQTTLILREIIVMVIERPQIYDIITQYCL